MIEYILFDVDDTLLDFGKAEATAIRKAFADMGIPVSEEIIKRYSEINSRQWARLERRELSREQVLVVRFDILFAELGLTLSSQRMQELYENYLSQGHWFVEGAEALLEALYGKYKLYIISNGTAKVQDGRLKSAGIGKYFESIFISEHIGHDKPNVEFFDACFAQIPDFDREKALIVGDRLSSDILGGINAKVKTCWFNPNNAPKNPQIPADYEIKSLSELPELLNILRLSRN